MPRITLITPVLLLLTGCAVTSAGGERMGLRSDAFAGYIETVFRRQNEVATDLLTELDNEDPESDRFQSLDAADYELQIACREMNSLARANRDGELDRGLAALRQARTAPECERATDAAAALL